MKGLRPAVATNLRVLYATDCFNLFAALKNESVDCVFADPPFNLGKDYGRGAVKDALERRDYLKWSLAWIDECVRLLKPGGHSSSTFCRHRDTISRLTSKSAACSSGTGWPCP